ncbi:MAG: response regulator transcription factor [Lachnospiraceae bacterium]|nr:response regulator transcription factor [Lachnospiraceae bacterium]MDY5742708.1 response regulator transcription factor [Lachnospiraceae bacterium]
MHKILIVEDDPVIRRSVTELLSGWGHQMIEINEFDKVLTVFLQENPHLVIMDISLPYFSGHYWLQEIRKISTVPVLIVSSHDAAGEVVLSINMGADDYITKPFESSILAAKVQGLLRRTYEFGAEEGWLEYDGLCLDTKSLQALYNGRSIPLTKNEFHILHCLMTARGSFVSRDRLMQELWQSDLFVDDNTLTVNMARLRRKLADYSLTDYIQTKKGLGYGVLR